MFVPVCNCINAYTFSIEQVRLICGSNDEILNVSEPTRCKYELDFQTPAACYNNSMFVYPWLPSDLQRQWNRVYSEFKAGIITQKVSFFLFSLVGDLLRYHSAWFPFETLSIFILHGMTDETHMVLVAGVGTEEPHFSESFILASKLPPLKLAHCFFRC